MSANEKSLLLATSSQDKIREYREIFADLPLKLVSPRELGIKLEIDETGETFQANAELKARAYWDATGLPCLAEDSGFEVDALGGAPGVHSARWEGSDYVRKNRLIVERLAGSSGVARRCRYACVIAFMDAQGVLHFTRGELTGRVAVAPAGSGGFGYDPIFYLPRLRQTIAQIKPAQKNELSHRGRAGRKIRPVVERALLAR